MHTLIVYESMYGNTHAVAEAIGDGVRGSGEARVVPVRDAGPDLLAWADLVVVGAPTHARGMPTSASRESAVAGAATDDGWSKVSLDAPADGPGIREWLDRTTAVGDKLAVAFDTRVHAPALITGRASSGIAKELRAKGFGLAAEPESFFVDTHQVLAPGELERATAWGKRLADRDLSQGSSVGHHPLVL
jgi:hypothetical protein